MVVWFFVPFLPAISTAFQLKRSYTLPVNDTFMKERPIFPLLVSMALPMVLSMTVNALYNIVDSFLLPRSVSRP